MPDKLFATTRLNSAKMHAVSCISIAGIPMFMGYIEMGDGIRSDIINLTDAIGRNSVWTVVDELKDGDWQDYAKELGSK